MSQPMLATPKKLRRFKLIVLLSHRGVQDSVLQ